MQDLPLLIYVAFIMTTAITLFLFYRAVRSKTASFIVLAWMTIQALIASTGFYRQTNAMPPRFFLAIGPPLVSILLLFASAKGRQWISNLSLDKLTMVHIMRIPVECILLTLFLYKLVPREMSFEGRNFDVLSGLTTPLVYFFVFQRKIWGPRALLFWNCICLLLLLNIVATAILSAPFPFQQFGLTQPNVALFYFPFVWLAAVIVPIVLFAHLAAIRQLLLGKKRKTGSAITGTMQQTATA